MTPECERYLEDPEANAAHLAECEDCRAFDASLRTESSVLGPRSSVAPEALPMAAWEGASHRSWALFAAGAVALAVLAVLLFIASGSSPAPVIRGDVVSSLIRVLDGGAIRNAPVQLQMLIGALFVIINAIFIALLRRAPKGIDV